jgi:hypothetical protein
MSAKLLPVSDKHPIEHPVADCRIYERQSCSLPTTCQPASALEMKEMRWAATISDISVGGLRIVLQRRFEKGTGLAIELPGTEQRESNVVFVKVIHVGAQANGTWALGCRFVSELSEDEMNSLLTATNHTLASSKKQDNQDKVDEDGPEEAPLIEPAAVGPEVRFLSDVQLFVETGAGAQTECLIKRLNVTKCWPLTPGKILSLNGKTGNQSAWSLRIQVTQCSQVGKGWEIQGRLVGSAASFDVLTTPAPTSN